MLRITATDLPRFMQCNGNILLEKFVSEFQDTSSRDEGNAAHWVAQQVHSGQITAEELIERKAYNGVYVTPEMVEHLSAYIEEIGCRGFVEYETSFKCPNGNWQVDSRADHINYEAGVLTVSDFKYGWRLVDVSNNWTLIAHAIGFISNNPELPVEKIIFKIFQPRPYHSDGPVRSCEISEFELRGLYAKIAQTLTFPNDILQTGEQCSKCPAMTNCPAYQSALMNTIEASEFAFNSNIDNENLGSLLDELERAKAVLDQGIKAYHELAMHRLKNGQIIKDRAIDTGLSNRTLKEFVTPEFLHAMTGRDDLVKKVSLSPKQLEVAGVPKELVAALCERKTTSPKLVRISANKKVEKLFNMKEKA